MGADLISHVNSHVISHVKAGVNWRCEFGPRIYTGANSHSTSLPENFPSIGSERFIQSQRYELTAVEPYIRQTDGGETVMLVWSSHCARCGESFHAKTSAFGNGALNRRCNRCKRPGVKVRARRRTA